ncbi:MAG: hypothetical protein Fues2KO_36340 [Fuerstiella sp.]
MNEAFNAGTFSGELGRNEFLKMFVAQVQHQDPLKPMEQTQILGQLAQFSQVEGMETLNRNFDTFLKQELQASRQLMDTSNSLLGQRVEFGDEQGTVDAVRRVDGEILVEIDGALMPVADITGIALHS